MRRWVWRILLAALVVAALTGSALAADIKDENFVYEEYGDGLEVKDYIVKNRADKKKQSVSIPEMYQGKPVRSIGEYAFGKKDDPSDPESSALRSITIPNSVDHISPFAFTGASALESIEIPGGVVIDESAFEGNQNVRSIEIHDDVSEQGEINYISASIGAKAFKGCSNLQEVILPSSLKVIKEEAFSGCSELTWIVIPFSVQTLETNAFKDCSSLENVVFRRGQVNFANSTGTELATAQVFPTLAKIDCFHCLKNSETYDKIFKAVKRLAPAGTKNKDEFAASRVHPIQVSPERETPSGLTKPRCKVKGNETNGTNGTITSKFICEGYDVTVETEVTKEDGTKETVTKKEHKDCECKIFKNSTHTYTQERKVSAPYHKLVKAEDIPSTCIKPGYTDRVKCSECGADLWSEEQKLAPHTYLEDDDPDGKTVVEELFPGRCVKDGDSLPGQNLVTKKCAVCGYTPVCWLCEDLKWRLEEADAKLKTAQAALEEAQAALEEAKAAKEQADAAKTAAKDALDEATKAADEAKNAHADAHAKTEEAQDALDNLAANATDEEKEEAQKKLDEAKDAEKKALAEYQAAETAKLRATLEKDRADAAVTEAGGALTTATSDEAAKQTAKTGKESAVWTARDALKDHLDKPDEQKECAECLKLLEAIRSAKSPSAKTKAEDAYTAHKNDTSATTTHKPEDIPEGVVRRADSGKPPEHQYVTVSVEWQGGTAVPDCLTGVPVIATKIENQVCSVCGQENQVITRELREPNGSHEAPEGENLIDRVIPGDCEHGEQTVYKDYDCAICSAHVSGDVKTTGKPLGHDMVHDEAQDIVVKATCTTPGSKTEVWVCSRGEKCSQYDGKPYTEQKEPVTTPALGHDWGDFVPNEGQDMTPNETCVEKKVKGSVSCKREGCGEKMDDYELTIEGLGKHTWGEWKADEGGKTETRTCSVCKKTETRNVSAPEPPDDPDDPDDPDKPDKPGEPEKPKDYSITVVPSAGGTASASSATAKSGASITLTVTPSSGYELDMMRAISGGTSVLTLTDLGGGKYRFTMPENNVEIRVTFARKSEGLGWGGVSKDNSTSGDPRRTTDVMPTQNPVQSVPRAGAYEQLFRDIPMSHWAAGEINWANQMGYMNGAGGRFNPDGNITHQQMWMVLARLTGNHPASMTEARRWAVDHSFADGSSPTGPVLRHQLVTALYRCAHLMGSTNRNTTSLAGYPDSRTVPTVARDAFSWAVANGIVGGTGNGRLAPNGTLTRAQFAVILYRYSQQI